MTEGLVAERGRAYRRFLKVHVLKNLVVLSLLAAVCLAVLIGLGRWQLQRLAWKESLIVRVEERSRTAPLSLKTVEAQWRKTGDVEYQRVTARGRFLHDKERYYFAPGRRGRGWHVYTPLQLSDGRVLWVNRGFVPEKLKDRTRRREGLTAGLTSIVGLARASGIKDQFTPDNDVARNVWFWRDLASMAASAYDKTRIATVPFFVEAGLQPVPGGWPLGGVTRVRLSNRHWEYALTWFGLAAALVGVYAAFVWGKLRAPGRDGNDG